MAPQYKYTVDLIAQTAQFEQNMTKAISSTRELGTSTKKAASEIVTTSKIGGMEFGKMGENAEAAMGSFGSAIGGAKGEMVSFIGTIVSAATPIGLLVAFIGGIAMAWKDSKEAIDAYLKSEERAQYGRAGFLVDSKDALKDTQKRAGGGIAEGIKLREDAERRLGMLGMNYTDEERKQLEIQKQMGIKMTENNQKLNESIGGQLGLGLSLKAQFEWKQKYSSLLLQDELVDKEKISQSTEINNLESGLLEIKTKIMGHSGTIAEREKLEKEFTEKARVIADKKLDLVEREYGVKSELYKMTGKNEEAELLTLNTANTKAEIERAYKQDLLQTIRLLNSINKEQGKIVKSAEELEQIQRRINSSSEAGYKLGTVINKTSSGEEKAGFSTTGQLKKKSLLNIPLVTPAGIDDLRKYAGLTEDEIKAIVKMNDELEQQTAIADELTDVFANMFSSIDGGVKAMAESVIKSIERIAAELAAKAVVFSIMSILFPKLMVGATLGSFLGLAGLKTPGLAEGGLAYGPTITQVGEYPGARSNPEVIAPLNKLQNMLQPSMAGGEVVFRIGERELVGLFVKANRINKNIRGSR